jgi:lipopolysaccharide export system protein LptA
MRLLKTLPILLGLSAALGSVSAWALPNDQDQPIRIQADDAQLDDKQGIATYTGNVIIIQGSMKVTGNTVTMTRTPAGDIDVVTAVGNLAYFEQLQTAGDPKPVQGWGVTIQYHTVRKLASAGRATGSKVTESRPRVDMVIQPKKKTDPQKAQ